MPITKQDKDRGSALGLVPVEAPDGPLTRISQLTLNQGQRGEVLVENYQTSDLVKYRKEIYPDKYVDPDTGKLADTQWEGREVAWFVDPRFVEVKVEEPANLLQLRLISTDEEIVDRRTGEDLILSERYMAPDGTIFRKEEVAKVRDATITTPFQQGFTKKKSISWYREPRKPSPIPEFRSRLEKNCPKCLSLLDARGECPLCARKTKPISDPRREAKIKGAVAPRSFPVDRRVVTAHAIKKLKAYGAKDVPIDSVDVPLLKILKDVRRKFVPAILVRGEDPFEHYDFDSLAQGSELVWNLLILWSEAWQLEGVAEALDYISPEQELMILDGIDNVHFKDTDELINTYADLILEFRQAQIDQNTERPEALYEQRAPVRLPPRAVEEKVKWRGIPTLMFREVICPHCGFVNKDHGIIDPKTKLPKPMECAMCGKSFRVEDAEKGIWRRAHKGDGPAKKLPIPGAPGSIPGSTPSLKKLFREIREMKDAEKTRGKIKTKSQKRRERRSRLKK